MARKNKHNFPKKHKTSNVVQSRTVSTSEIASTIIHSNVTPAKAHSDSDEVAVSAKYSDLPFEIRRVGIVTATVIIVLLVLWLIFK